MSDVSDYLGARVREAQLELGLSQAALGRRLHRSQVTISDIERGRVNVSVVFLYRLALLSDKPLSYFLPVGWRLSDD